MNTEIIEETIQTIGKTRFVVVSRFQADGSPISDRVKRLLEREAQTATQNRTLAKKGQSDYNENVNTV